MIPIEFQLVHRERLAARQKAAMLELIQRHFDGVTAEVFARDLAEKNLALLLHRGCDLVGFSTLAAYTAAFEGRPINVIYSGDTIVTPEAWGSSALPRAWVAGVDALRESLPSGRCFWLLLSSGFRTYRFLPVFWREFFPRCDAATPTGFAELMRELGHERFGSQFNAATGVVRFHQAQKLRGTLSEIPHGRENDPHIAFFLARNPGHHNGDELVCLTELCPENLTAAGRRMMRPVQHEMASRHR
jgi:hypothetical protein